MKRTLAATLFTLILASLGGGSARADLIWYEGFSYADGPITNTSGGVWVRHSGSGGSTTAFVKDNKLEISGNSSTNAPRQDDIHRDFCTSSCTYTSAPIAVYASFTINCTNLPTAVSNYIAHFYVSSTTFHGRVHAMSGTLPGTWRLGISGASTPVSKIFPVDLAPNVDYQVVVGWNPTASDVPPLFSSAASLWINPLSSADTAAISSDTVASPAASVAYGFRQAAGTTSFFAVITNLAIATTFEEAATNVWDPTPFAPTILYQPKSVTNFEGAPVTLSVVANGQSLGDLTYQWVKDDIQIGNPAGNSNVYPISSLSSLDAGQYKVIVANPTSSLSVTSDVASVEIDTSPIPPYFVSQPASTNVYPGQTATFSVAVAGPQPISTLWYRNDVSLSDDATFSGTATPILTVLNVQANNNTTGTFKCVASNVNGDSNSLNATLSVVLPVATNIIYLRSLVDRTFFLPTNTTKYWTASGVVSVYTNLTGSPNLSTVIQDGTAGIGVFMGGGASQLPEAGTAITVTGPLGNFNGALQFALNASDPSTFFVTNSTGNPLPAPIVLPLTFTNGIGYGGVSNLFRQYMSSRVMFTNVYFTDGLGTYGTGQITEFITNKLGTSFKLFFNAAVTPNFTGQLIPERAWTVTGVLSTFLSPAETNRSIGFQLLPTRYEDYITTAPQPTAPTIALVANKPVINWTAELLTSYTILTSANVSGPYVPLASGLTFNTAAGQFTDTNAVSGNRFYEIISP